jgi:SnoaL-like domain
MSNPVFPCFGNAGFSYPLSLFQTCTVQHPLLGANTAIVERGVLIMNVVEIVDTFMSALQAGDLELAARVMADDFTLTGLAPKDLNKGQFLALQSELKAAMPDFTYNLQDAHFEGDTVHATISMTGLQRHDLSLPMFGLPHIPASGIEMILPQTDVTYSVAHEQVVSMQMEIIPGGGLSGLLQQVGSDIRGQREGEV